MVALLILLFYWKALIEAGAEIDWKNEEESTPLHLAAKAGRTMWVMSCGERLKKCGVCVFKCILWFMYVNQMQDGVRVLLYVCPVV